MKVRPHAKKNPRYAIASGYYNLFANAPPRKNPKKLQTIRQMPPEIR